MTSPTFETQVLTQLDDITERLGSIELKVSGSNGDPNNQGIFGALATMDAEVDVINTDITGVKAEQTRQKAWLKGAAASAGLSAAGVSVVLAKVFNAI